MPPIRIFSDAPINGQKAGGQIGSDQPPSGDHTAAKPDGITPQTALPPTRTTPQTIPSRTQDASLPPAPQPGARPQPPFMPAPTSGLDDLSTIPNPPPPQPGAMPQSVTKTITSTVSERVPPPPQFSYAPPQDSNRPSHSTSTDQPGRTKPTTLSMGSALGHDQASGNYSLEHPPNYVQNPYAANDTPAQGNVFHDTATTERDENGVMAAVGDAVKGVGESLKKGEEAVWRWVGGKT